jgi:hypothetical protein
MKEPKVKLLQLITGIGIIWIGLSENGKAEPTIADITKELEGLRKSTKVIPDSTDCGKILEDIRKHDELADKLGGEKHFSNKEIQFFTANCKHYKPSSLPTVAAPASKTAGQMHMPTSDATESSDTQMKVTSALNTLAEQPANKKNCEQRAQLIETFDNLAKIDGKKPYSIEERNYFLKDCFSVIPEKPVLTHKAPKPPVPTGFMGELQAKMKKRQERDAAVDDLDKLLGELQEGKQNK